jgi:LMBR1 domain-containing protein 1
LGSPSPGAMNPVLIVGMSVVMFLTLIASLYILVYFQHEEDRNTAWVPKVVVLIGLSLACWVVMALPLDIANSKVGGGLRIDIVWQVLYTTIAIWCMVVIPFAIFYYESEDPEQKKSAMWAAVKWTLASTVVSGVVTFIMWAFLGTALIPVSQYSVSTLIEDGDMTYMKTCQNVLCGFTPAVLTIGVTPVVYVVAMITFLGWFLFVVFGGIGLAALPLDLFSEYANRPVPMNLEDYAKQKMILNERARALIEIGQRFSSREKRTQKTRRTYNKFKQAVYFLDKDWDKVKLAYKKRGGNPLMHLLNLVLGVIASALSLLWLIHVFAYVFITPPRTTFLNGYFVALDKFFPLFGTLTYAIFALYLLFCVMKGNIKFGLRVFFFQIHPMQLGNTMMNSLLFNTELILLCSVSVVHFCQRAFDVYTRLTDIDQLLGNQVENLRFLRYFFQNGVFIYIFIGLACLSFMYLLTFPKEQKQEKFDNDDD